MKGILEIIDRKPSWATVQGVRVIQNACIETIISQFERRGGGLNYPREGGELVLKEWNGEGET